MTQNNPTPDVRAALEACPFCGGVANLQWHTSPACWVECESCGAVGPNDADTTTEQNVAAWNTRAAIAACEEWQPIETAPPGEPLIGLRLHPVGAQPYFVGERYDLGDGALIDRWTGRWVRCSHWMRPLPSPPETAR